MPALPRTAYLSIGFQSRKALEPEIQAIRQILAQHKTSLFIFTDHFHFSPEQEKEMMNQAFSAIRNADLLIAEVSEKAIGVGVETGYAKALKMPVIYLRNSIAEHSTTAAGTADYIIIYQNTTNLTEQLSSLLPLIQP